MTDPASEHLTVTKYGARIAVHRTMLVDYGLVEPTEVERVERDAWRAEYDQRKQAATEALPVFLAALAAVTDPVARVVLDLHKAESGRCGACCTVCGDEGYGPGWPCSTVETVAKALDIDVPPDLDLVTIADNG